MCVCVCVCVCVFGEGAIVTVRKDDRLLREHGDICTLMVGKIMKLPREKATWMY